MAKITHIFKTYFPETNGGLEEAIRQYGSHAAKNGFEVEVVSVGSGNYTVTSIFQNPWSPPNSAPVQVL